MYKILLAALPVFILVSCQKEIGLDSPSAPGGGDGLLVKAVAVIGSDSTVTLYGYDSQKRLETTTTDGSSNGMVIHNYRQLVRDASGRIVRILQKQDQSGISSDTSVNLIHYSNGTTMEYDYSVNNIGALGITVIDSSLYSFSGGKLSSVLSYLSMPDLGMGPLQSSKYDYSYDASGRVSLIKVYSSGSLPGSPLTAIANETFTYGTSINSEWTSNNAAQNYLIGGMPNSSNEAVVKLQVDDLTNPSNSITANMNYVLGANKKPVSSTMTITGGQSQVTHYTYYYQ